MDSQMEMDSEMAVLHLDMVHLVADQMEMDSEMVLHLHMVHQEEDMVLILL